MENARNRYFLHTIYKHSYSIILWWVPGVLQPLIFNTVIRTSEVTGPKMQWCVLTVWTEVEHCVLGSAGLDLFVKDTVSSIFWELQVVLELLSSCRVAWAWTIVFPLRPLPPPFFLKETPYLCCSDQWTPSAPCTHSSPNHTLLHNLVSKLDCFQVVCKSATGKSWILENWLLFI